MTAEEFERVQPVIEMAQRLESKLHARVIAGGVAPIDALIGAVYAAHTLASHLHNGPVGAVEWMRDALDTIERQAMRAGVAK